MSEITGRSIRLRRLCHKVGFGGSLTINLKHPLVRLTDLINWERLGTSMSGSFVSGKGRPASSPRLIAGLLYLQHAFDLSDEEVVWQWVENPY